MIRRLWLLIALCIIVRVVYWLQVSDEAWFLAPGTDPEFYSNWAEAILAGHASDYIPFPRAPLYSYLIAGIMWIFGSGWLWIRLLNLTFDVITMLLIYRFGMLTGDRRLSSIAAILFALSGAAVYFSGETLMTSLAVSLTMTFLLSLVLAWRENKLKYWILSGLLLGLAALLRPNMLLIAPFSALMIGVHSRRSKSTSRVLIKRVLPHLAAVVIILAPVTIVNLRASGEFVPISLQGGVNFFIGNARGVTGWSSTLPGFGAAWEDSDAAQLAEDNSGRFLTPPQVSSQFWRMGWHEIKAAPFEWITLLVKKSLLLTNIREIGNNRPLTLAREGSLLIKLLFLISVGTLFPFALVGIRRYWKRIEFKGMLIFSLIISGSLLLFFVNSRYRMPLLPIVSLFAAVGIISLWDRLRGRTVDFRDLILLAVGFLVAVPNWFGDTFEEPAQVEYVAGNALMRMGDHREAIERYQKGLKFDPVFNELHLNYGVALLNTGDTLSAREEFLTELENNPNNAKALNNLGVVSEGSGDVRDAQAYYQWALEANPRLEDARINLSRIYLRQTKERPGDPQPWQGLAVIAAMSRQWKDTHLLLSEALRRDPFYQPSLDLLKALEMKE